MSWCPQCGCDSLYGGNSSDKPTAYCQHCGYEEHHEELCVSNPYEEERYRSYCPECKENTVWLRMVEENEAWCENCGLFEDQAEDRIQEGE